MGIPKHSKLSARSKNSARYAAENRRSKNKQKNIASQEAFELKQKAKNERKCINEKVKT